MAGKETNNMSKPKTRDEARAKIAKVFKGRKPYKISELRECYANALLKVKINDPKLPAKERKKYGRIIGKHLVKAMMKQDLKEILNP